MKRSNSAKTKITTDILRDLCNTKANDKVAQTKPVVKETPLKSPDLSHDAGGAYNTDSSFLQQ